MNKKQVEILFSKLIEDADLRFNKSLEDSKPLWESFEIWRTACRDAIEQIYGPAHRNLIEFNELRFSPASQTSDDNENLLIFLIGLSIAKQKLTGMLITIQFFLPEEQVKPNVIYPIVFLSYAKKSQKIASKLKDFLIALGAVPLDMFEMPNISMSIEEKINSYLNSSNCAIIIYTGEDTLLSGEKRARPNLDHEMGLISNSESIGNRIILLKENGVNLPTNYQQRAYISFKKNYFCEIFIPLIRELKGFGFL